MKLRDIMRSEPWTVRDDTTLGDAQRIMTAHDIRHLPVVRNADILCGLLSQQDVLARRASAGADEIWWKQPVSAAMQLSPQTAGPDESLTEAAGRMAAAKIDSLPIVDRGHLLGLVTVTDVLDAEVRSAMAPTTVLLTAGDVMSPEVVTARFDDLLSAAATRMATRRLRHLPVVDNDCMVIGMLSDRDLRGRMSGRNHTTAQVRDVMTTPVITVTLEQSLEELATILVNEEIGAVPVLSARGTLLGIVSYVDVLVASFGVRRR